MSDNGPGSIDGAGLRRIASVGASGALIGKAASVARDLVLLASLGLSAELDAFILWTVVPGLVVSGNRTVLQSLGLARSRAARAKFRLPRVLAASIASLLGTLVFLNIAEGSIPSHTVLVVTTLYVATAACTYEILPQLFENGRSWFATAVPFFGSLTVASTATSTDSPMLLLTAMAVGWGVDLLVALALSFRTADPALTVPLRDADASAWPLLTVFLLSSVSILLDRWASSQFNPGDVATVTLANRIVFASLSVLVAGVLPFVVSGRIEWESLRRLCKDAARQTRWRVRAGVAGSAFGAGLLLVLWASPRFGSVLSIYLLFGPAFLIQQLSTSALYKSRMTRVFVGVGVINLLTNALGNGLAVYLEVLYLVPSSTGLAGFISAVVAYRALSSTAADDGASVSRSKP